MLDTFKSLPEDPDELRAISVQMAQHIQSQAYQIEKLKAELHGHRKARFGSKSEAMDQLALDLSEDDEIAQAADEQQAEPSSGDEDPTAKARTKRQHCRKPLPYHLDRKDEVLSPGDACDGCGGTLRQVSEDITEELDYIPGHFVVRRFIRPRMACTCCEAFAQAPLPSRLIERGRPGPGLVSHMLVGKYCDHLPLERQSKIYAREGVDLHRSTLSDWVGRTTALLEPLAAHIGKLVREGPALFADDTPVKLQVRANTTKTKTARLWSYVRYERPWCVGPLRLAHGTSSASIGRASTPSIILLAIPAPSMPIATPDSMGCSARARLMNRPAWSMCAASSLTKPSAPARPLHMRRSSALLNSMPLRKR